MDLEQHFQVSGIHDPPVPLKRAQMNFRGIYYYVFIAPLIKNLYMGLAGDYFLLELGKLLAGSIA
jgi:hypothetical protein